MTRKGLLWIRLILLILLFLVIAAGIGTSLIFGLHGRAEGGTVRSFAGVEKISVDSVSLPVHIMEGNVTEVTVTDNTQVFGLALGKKHSVHQTDDTLYLNEGNHFPFMFGVSTGEINIEVPKGTALEYRIKVTSGSASLDAPSKNTLEIKNISGSVKVLQGGDSLDLVNTSGSVQIDSGFETARVKSISGTVLISTDAHSKKLTCDNTSGSMKIRMKPISGYDIKYSTISGSLRDLYHDIDYNKDGHNIYGDGSLKLEAKNISGSIKLCDWNSSGQRNRE